jgi:hypothetical protein
MMDGVLLLLQAVSSRAIAIRRMSEVNHQSAARISWETQLQKAKPPRNKLREITIANQRETARRSEA